MGIRATLCEIIVDGKLLLQRKSSGRFGEGKWNGPGGKLKPGETPRDGVIREVQEETGLTVSDLSERGIVEFFFGEKPEPDWVVHIFLTNSYSGEVKASEEGELKWFSLDEIPYSEMWEDDTHWLPVLLEGKRFTGSFVYDEEGERILRYEMSEG
ncbi:MAG: 8-oxo-dGTP diphosphatase [Candidatus Bathyarchaeota archaeon]|nr:8-oxo-dGTP diphosphatase [Candidatus Bathyarchaeota archaeon]